MKINTELIKPNMIIHCPERYQAVFLLDTLGDEYNDTSTHWDIYKERTCYRIGSSEKIVKYQTREFYFRNGCSITNFADILDQELSARELLKIHQIVCTRLCCHICPFYENSCLKITPYTNIEETIKICSKISKEIKHVQN